MKQILNWHIFSTTRRTPAWIYFKKISNWKSKKENENGKTRFRTWPPVFPSFLSRSYIFCAISFSLISPKRQKEKKRVRVCYLLPKKPFPKCISPKSLADDVVSRWWMCFLQPFRMFRNMLVILSSPTPPSPPSPASYRWCFFHRFPWWNWRWRRPLAKWRRTRLLEPWLRGWPPEKPPK